jgi:hypothetical protein
MKYFLSVILVLLSLQLLAIVMPPPKRGLHCVNTKNKKLVTIWPNTSIIICYKNNSDKLIKTNGVLRFVEDSILILENKKKSLLIPLSKIEKVSKRNNARLLENAIAFVPSAIISRFAVQLLSRVSRNNNTPGYSPNDGNGLAGVVGIVIGIISFPLFVISSIGLVKQLLQKTMDIKNGWKFAESKM